MQSTLITPVILAGGSGTRLWPMSREDNPKQFCDLGLGKSLFQASLQRISNKTLFEKPVVVCLAKHESTVREQAAKVEVDLGRIICEPFGRNTAAAMALAALSDTKAKSAQFLVLPSDHKFQDNEQFETDIKNAQEIVSEYQKIVLFGVTPTTPETGYGYVRAGAGIESSNCSDIIEFIEKPSDGRVETLVQEKNVYWNSGVFFFRKDVFLKQLSLHSPDILRSVRSAVYSAATKNGIIHPDQVLFAKVPNISFDYAVMEKTNSAVICKLSTGWSDLGSWKSIWETQANDCTDNISSDRTVNIETTGCLVTTDGPMVGTIGLEDIVVVANRDAVLVCHKDKTQKVKDIVSELENSVSLKKEPLSGEVRPWGNFQSIDRGLAHQVKRIEVNPGGQLSLQYHFHRSEHWIVVRGIATVTVEDTVKNLGPCEQVFIPQGAVHRLENFTDEPVEIIEIQYGDYLGEDDIVRIEDIYDRPARECRPELSKVA